MEIKDAVEWDRIVFLSRPEEVDLPSTTSSERSKKKNKRKKKVTKAHASKGGNAADDVDSFAGLPPLNVFNDMPRDGTL